MPDYDNKLSGALFKNQKGFYNLRNNPKHRANNRKTNRRRKMQSIKFLSKSWPPVFLNKEIKTFK